MGLLGPGDPPPVAAENCGGNSPFLFVCDHAGRVVPGRLERLGLPGGAFDTHIAWDIGALDLARRLAAGLGAGLIHQAYSRLTIDCNRSPGHPHSIVGTSDGWSVSGNHGLTQEAALARRLAIFDPYHARISAELDARAERGVETLLVCVHSFTPTMGGTPRPWDIGVLHMGDSGASHAMLSLLRRELGLVVGDNEPYAMDGTDFTAPFHAHRRGLDAIELEVRQDWLQRPDGLKAMTEIILRLLPAARERIATI
jgi:predicted N-formylglutamate amidohydrolase